MFLESLARLNAMLIAEKSEMVIKITEIYFLCNNINFLFLKDCDCIHRNAG